MEKRVIIGVPLRCQVNENGAPIEYIFDYVRRAIFKVGGEVSYEIHDTLMNF